MTDRIVEAYLTEMTEIRGTRANVPETSFYPALERLLTNVGKSLSPRVRCVINLANRGAGLPDGGLFSAEQFQRKTSAADAEENPFTSQSPSRGVIEAKPLRGELEAISGTKQVERYWKRYGVVLVTNFRSFALIGKGTNGQPVALESFSIADSEKAFWLLAFHPRKTASEKGERLLEYLKRVLLHNAPLTAPQDVAGILASYAHDARLRIESVDLPALNSLREALEEALGLRFEGEKGEHFFRSTLIQTLFYGVFSAWVLWARRRDAKPNGAADFGRALRKAAARYPVTGNFDWRSADWLLRVPMLRALFHQVADPTRLGALGLIEVLDWAAGALNRVDRAEFFKSYDEGHAVQYFYEPFLHAFDPALRKELGVWYTPEEIVNYQVERVDAVLRSELDLPDGLADPKVIVLDPCCGTGAYLRAVLRRIACTLHDKGGDALVANDLKTAAMERVFGFEILPAPFVIAHLQLGLELEKLGAPLSDREDPSERVGVYLTNALSGWEPPKEKPKQIAFPGFEDERDAAGKVKNEKPILVILGNPPYNAFAGISPKDENRLVEPYKEGLISEWGIKKFNLDDLYIRFFRLAEKRIAEHGGRGLVSFISNFSYIGDPSFVVARRRFLDGFDAIWIDCMNGDSRETGKLTPDGKPDPSVFSTEWNREGIRVGTAIGLFAKRGRTRKGEATVRFRHFWGATKRADLLASIEEEDIDSQYELANPRKDNRWSLRPAEIATAYLRWPTAVQLCAVSPVSGLQEMRKGALMALDAASLEGRMKRYFDAGIDWKDLCSVGLCEDAGRFRAQEARTRLLKTTSYDDGSIRKYALYPYDQRWCYYTNVRPLWNEPRPSLVAQGWDGNRFFVTRMMAERPNEGAVVLLTKSIPDYHLLRPNAVAIPLRLKAGQTGRNSRTFGERLLPGMEIEANRITANLSPASRTYLRSLDLPDPDTDQNTAELIWYHALAIGYAPAYLTENSDGIRQDWPRIPLPRMKEELLTSADLGRQVAALLDTETPVPGLTIGKIRDELKPIALFQRVDGKPAKPEAGNLDLTAGWGHGGKGGVTMPGKGKMVRREDGGWDIFLNEVACWRNVPEAVWDYTIGGYQVIKKWLSYREKALLGRGLTSDEVRYVTEVARRLSALVALKPQLDENYKRTTTDTYAWTNRKDDLL